MESENEVICLVCGAHMSRLTVTHLKTHGLGAMAEYRERYPGAQLVSEKQRRECSAKITAARRASGWFTPEGRDRISETWKQLHASGATSGEHHWSHGIATIRGQRIPVEQLRTELEGYVADDLTLREMAEKCQVYPRSITKWLKRFGLQQGMRRGERSPNWLGGATDKHRGLTRDEYAELQRRVFERDHYTCQKCGQVGGRLGMHHVIPYRETQDNSIDNMTTLCQSCHIKTELESGAWKKEPEMCRM